MPNKSLSKGFHISTLAELPPILPPANEISIYIHWPFCLMKCPYCDFNSYVSKKIDQKSWLKAYFNAFAAQSKYFEGKKIKSIFFGGGTPSLMDPQITAEIINYFTTLNKQAIAEITLESNPSTFEIAKFKDFAQAGVNRLSTGIQSFNNDFLKFLGRNHNSNEAKKALEQSKEIFAQTTFDLIMGLPKQTFEMWQQELAIALNHINGHISIYQLTIEEGTSFFKRKVPEAHEDIASQIYEYNITELAKINLYQYEISNFAKTGAESIHNLNYWLGGEYLGIGPNAHGRVFYENSWYATREIKNPNKWLQKAVDKENLLDELTEINSNERQIEIIMTTLRTNNPVPKYLVQNIEQTKIDNLITDNLIIANPSGTIQTTTLGKMCLNFVIKELLA